MRRARPSRELSNPFSSDAALHQNERAWVWSTCLERERARVSVFIKKGRAIKAYRVLLLHRKKCAIGCGGPAIVVCGRATRELLAIWPLVLEGLCFGVVSTELNRESIFFLSVCISPPGLALPHAAWGSMSCCPDESKAFCGWAHLSSAVGLQLWRLPSLPLFSKRGALTLSAAAGTFENNCLYDCYFSYLFEEV